MNALEECCTHALRCRHREYSDFLTKCEGYYSFCFSCLRDHLQKHFVCPHSISKNYLEPATISLSIGVSARRWHLSFSTSLAFTQFFSQFDLEIDGIHIKDAGRDPASVCMSLIKYDKCRAITATENIIGSYN